MTRLHPHAGPARPRRPAGGGRYRIGEAAGLVGVSASALRLWERQGLVKPSRSLGGRYRLYSDEDIERLRRIRRLRTVERVNAPGIRHLLAGSDAHAGRSGARLRALREARGMSLREASLQSGLSISFISAVERGTSGASVAALQRLTSAYGTTMLELLGGAHGGGRLLHPPDRPAIELDDGRVRIEQLAADATLLEPQLFVLAPGATSQGAYAHAGEEFMYLLSGSLRVWIGEAESYRLVAGDALSFPSTLQHRWRNESGEETRLIWINTPPTF